MAHPVFYVNPITPLCYNRMCSGCNVRFRLLPTSWVGRAVMPVGFCVCMFVCVSLDVLLTRPSDRPA